MFNMFFVNINNNINEKWDFLKNIPLNVDDFSEEPIKEIKHQLSHFMILIKHRQAKVFRKSETFVVKNGEWLKGISLILKEMNQTGQPSTEPKYIGGKFSPLFLNSNGLPYLN